MSWPTFLDLEVGKAYVLAEPVPDGKGIANIEVDKRYSLPKGSRVRYLGMVNTRSGVTNVNPTDQEKVKELHFVI